MANSNPMARRLRRLARERGWALARVARRGGFTPSNLLVWARLWPRNTQDTTARVARALGISVDELLDDVENEPLEDVHEEVLMAVRLPDKEAVAKLKELDLDWNELIRMERNWRVSDRVRAWMRQQLADLNARISRCQRKREEGFSRSSTQE